MFKGDIPGYSLGGDIFSDCIYFPFFKRNNGFELIDIVCKCWVHVSVLVGSIMIAFGNRLSSKLIVLNQNPINYNACCIS